MGASGTVGGGRSNGQRVESPVRADWATGTLPPMGALAESGRLDRVDRAAVRDGTQLFVPAIPFGLVVGVAIIESELPASAGWVTSPAIFAGASQLATVTLAGVATMWAVIVAALVINSRHVMYSAALATTFRHQPPWFRLLAPFFLIDQVFALVIARTDRPAAAFRRYYLSLGLFLYVMWIGAVSVGMLLGPLVSPEWRLDLAPAVMFTGMVVIALDRMPATVAATVGAAVGFAASNLPDRMGILVGATAGVIAGAIAETVAGARGQTRQRGARS